MNEEQNAIREILMASAALLAVTLVFIYIGVIG
jgi:hypothetical protein